MRVSLDEMEYLECCECENWINLTVTPNPKDAKWKLKGFGVWWCPDCALKHSS